MNEQETLDTLAQNKTTIGWSTTPIYRASDHIRCMTGTGWVITDDQSP